MTSTKMPRESAVEMPPEVGTSTASLQASTVKLPTWPGSGTIGRGELRLALGAIPLGIAWGALIGAELALPVLPVALVITIALIALLLAIRHRWPGIEPARVERSRHAWALAIFTAGLVIALGAIAFQPHITVLGGRDPGVYVNTAYTIATTGQIYHYDDLLESLDARIGDWVFSDAPAPWVRPGMPGYQIANLHVFAFQPHGFHAWPAMLAAAFAALGWTGLLFLPVALRLWNLGIMALIGRTVGGPFAGLLAVAFLGTNVGAIWYGRTHAAEILVQTACLTGILFGARAIRYRSAADATLAGIAFGVVHLTKIEFVQIPVFLIIVLAILHARGWSLRALAWFAVPYFVLVLHAAVHAVLLAPSYTVGQVMGMLPSLDWMALNRADAAHPFVLALWLDLARSNAVPLLIGAGVAVGIVGIAIWLAIGGRRYPAAFGVRSTPLIVIFVTGLLFVLLSRGAAVAAPEQLGPLGIFRYVGNPQSLLDVSLYAHVLGLLLAGLGVLLAPFYARDRADRAVLGFLLVGAAPMLFVNWLADDHFWAGRRYVPILLPAVSLYAGLAIVWTTGVVRKRLTAAWAHGATTCAGAALAMLLVAANVQTSLPLLGHIENAGALTELERVARELPDDGIIVMPWEEYSGLLITPLVVIHDQRILAIDSERAAQPGLTELYDRLTTRKEHLYWLGIQPPGLPEGFVARPIGPIAFRVPRAEAPSGRLPQAVVWYDVPLVLFGIERAGPAAQGS